MIKVKFVCNECGEEFYASEAQKTSFVASPHGANDWKTIWLTYVVCPRCGHKHFVQIDNDESNNTLEQQIRLFENVARRKKRGLSVGRKQSSKYSRANLDLTKIRKGLSIAYEGARAVDPVSGDKFIVNFCNPVASVYDLGDEALVK